MKEKGAAAYHSAQPPKPIFPERKAEYEGTSGSGDRKNIVCTVYTKKLQTAILTILWRATMVGLGIFWTNRSGKPFKCPLRENEPVLCPRCGSFLKAGATRCGSCRTSIQ